MHINAAIKLAVTNKKAKVMSVVLSFNFCQIINLTEVLDINFISEG